MCLYCGSNHSAKLCSSRFTLVLDPFSLVKIVLRRRTSKSSCTICGEDLPVGGLEVVQLKKAKGKFVQAIRVHKTCFDQELVRKEQEYYNWLAYRQEEIREKNRNKARERYRRSREGGGP